MDKLYIVMPAYNEQENIEAVVREWYPVLDGKDQQSRLVVADSGSTDCTHQIMTELKKKYPKIEILSETGKQHGPKLLALYGYAAEAGADYVFQTDSDGQTSAAEFDIFWKQRENISYQFPIGTIKPDIRDEYMEELRKEMPKLIIVQHGHDDSTIAGFLNENNYVAVWSEDTEHAAAVYEHMG